MLVKVNSLGGVSESEAHTNIVTTVLNQSDARTPKTRPASSQGESSVPTHFGDNFSDKRRRLLSTPLLTGYYVTDRPPDGLSHNNREC